MPMMYIKSSIWSGFEIKNWIEAQYQSSPKLVEIWTVLRCIFVPNLEIVTSIGGELWHAQAQNGVNFDFGVQFDLEGHNQSSHKTIGRFTKVFYNSSPNLVILAKTVDDLSHGQTRDWRTHGHTHTHTHVGNDNTRRPKLASGKNDTEDHERYRCKPIFDILIASPIWNTTFWPYRPWYQGSWGQHGAHLGPTDPGGLHVGPMNLDIWDAIPKSYWLDRQPNT